MNAPIRQIDVIRAGVPAGVRVPSHQTKPCPFCGENPPLAALPVAGRYVVGCENDDCPTQPQAAGSTLAEAWSNWNRRAS